MDGPRHPENRWFWPAVAAVTVVALLTWWYVYRSNAIERSFAAMSESARKELAALEVPAGATAQIERSWVSDGFTTPYLMAPVGPRPCRECAELVAPRDRAAVRYAFSIVEQEPDAENRQRALAEVAEQHPENLAVALLFATDLIESQLYADADRVISRALDRTFADEQVIAAAKRTGSDLDLSDIDVSTIIHLHHALGVTRLSGSSAGPPWKALKNVIGSVKQLSRRRLIGTTLGQPTASRLAIAAPGCAESTGSLTSYDLYNNLIVGYTGADFRGAALEREREFARPARSHPGPVYSLLLAQLQRERAAGWKNEAELWALSNAEQVLDWRRPDDARLAFNIIQLLEWWIDPARCPADVCTPQLKAGIRAEQDALLVEAFHRRNVTDAQRADFATGMTRMLAQSTVDRARIENDAQSIRGWLPSDRAATLDDLLNADRARKRLAKWIIDADAKADSPFEPLGRRAEAWRHAALSDFAAAAAQWGLSRSVVEKKQLLVAIRQLLGVIEAPPEVRELEAQLPWSQRMRIRFGASKAWWLMWGFGCAAILWLVIVWVLLQIREWRLLRLSFYNVELDHLRRGR